MLRVPGIPRGDDLELKQSAAQQAAAMRERSKAEGGGRVLIDQGDAPEKAVEKTPPAKKPARKRPKKKRRTKTSRPGKKTTSAPKKSGVMSLPGMESDEIQ